MFQARPESTSQARGGPTSRVFGVLQPGAVQVHVHASVLDEVLAYGERDLRRELGGFLLGQVWEGVEPASDGRDLATRPAPPSSVEVRYFLPALDTRSRGASLTFTHETWSHLHREVAKRFPEEVVVGWQHTHPDLGVFLSGYDLFIHRHFFHQPWQIALVLDPVRGEFAFFQWRGDDVVDCGFVCLTDGQRPDNGPDEQADGRAG